MAVDLAIQLGALFVAMLGIILTGVRQLNATERRLADKIMLHQQQMQETLDKKITAIYNDIEADRRTVGESLQAVRQQVSDLKVSSLETFVRRDSFHKFLDSIVEARQSFESDIKQRLSELQRKLDRLVERDTARGDSK